MIKRQKPKNSKTIPEIIYKDKVNTTPESIANGFADYLHELYQPSTKSSFDDRRLHEFNETNTEIKQTCKEETMVYLPGGVITENDVACTIRDLKL